MDNIKIPGGIRLINRISANPAAKTILIAGVFHGEEPQGEYVIDRYMEENGVNGSANHLHFIPCLNPWGKERGLRVNANGVDLNRNYPTKNWTETPKDENYSGPRPASEAETRFMIKLVDRLQPDLILTLHAPLRCVNYDGPAKGPAGKIAEICGYPVVADLGYPTPGSFGTYCGIERNIPIVTLEYGEDETPESLYAKTAKVFDWLGNL